MEELVNLKTAPAHDLGVTGAHSDLQFLLFVCNVGVLHNNNKIQFGYRSCFRPKTGSI